MISDILHEISVSGVNHSLPGNGGEECVGYIPHWQRILETVIFVWLSCYGVKISLAGLGVQKSELESLSSKPAGLAYQNGNSVKSNSDNEVISLGLQHLRLSDIRPMISYLYNTLRTPFADRLIFNVYFGVFVGELLYKIVTKTAIFLLNPCHLSTILQLILMKMPKSDALAVQIFRFHLYTVPGALVAVLFPILNTRLMHGEVLIYYIQHGLILFIPLYLMMTRDSFRPEALLNMSWAIFSVSMFILYHFIFLQFVAFITHVNLNCILCPAVSDPFSGRTWRVFAVAHQSVAIPVVAKTYGFVSTRFIAVVGGLSLSDVAVANRNEGNGAKVTAAKNE